MNWLFLFGFPCCFGFFVEALLRGPATAAGGLAAVGNLLLRDVRPCPRPENAVPAVPDPRLRIGFDATTVGVRDAQRGGVYQYVWQVLRRLAGAGHGLRLLFALPHPRHRGSIAARLAELGGGPGATRAIRAPLPERWLRRLGAPIEALVGRVDVFHAPAHLNLRSHAVPTVVTIHDLAFLADVGARLATRGLSVAARRRHAQRARFFVELRQRTERSVAGAARVIAVSEATRRDLLGLCPWAADRVEVVHLGVRAGMVPVADPLRRAAACRRIGVAEPFWLYLGVLDPNKNLEVLLEAYRRYRDGGGAALLVLAGHDDFYREVLELRVRQLEVARWVRFPGFVADADLAALYSAARGVVMPSALEGFGIPAIEAMACGTPVVAAAARALPEVVGPAGVLVDPASAAGFAAAMLLLEQDERERVRLVRLGMDRAAGFDWDRTAAATVAVYRRALATA